MGSREFYAHIWDLVTSISHMGEILDSDWSRDNLLRSDWSGPYCSHYDYYNCLLKGGPLPRHMKDTGMFDTISIVSFSSIDTFQANLVWYRYIFQNYVYLLFYSWRIRAANKKKYHLSHCFNEVFLSPLSDISKLQLCFYWRVIYAGATINVTCLTYPQRP